MRRLVFTLLLMLAPWGAGAADQTVDVSYGGLDRSYLLHLPNPLPNNPMPLVVVLHGGGGNAENVAHMTGFDAAADHNGFIVVYPNGTGGSSRFFGLFGRPGMLTWNAGTCCGYAHDNNVDDVGFIRAVVTQVLKDNGADSKRIYATGISNGGMMAYRLACEASDLFAAIAPVSAVQEVAACKPEHPVSVFHIHGAKDENVPLEGGIGRKALEKENRAPVQQTIDFWAKQDQCTVTLHSNEPDISMTNYGGCTDRTDVQYFVIADGGHSWPGGERVSRLLDPPSQAMHATADIWEFFSHHEKP